MTEGELNVVGVNLFTGLFLALVGGGLLVVSRNVVTAAVFVLIGLFFLTRALAQYQARHADS